jgi:hypothetical protein
MKEELAKLQVTFDNFKRFPLGYYASSLMSIGFCYTFGYCVNPLVEEEDEEMKEEEGQDGHAVPPYAVKECDLAPPALDSLEKDPNNLLPSDMAASNRV